MSLNTMQFGTGDVIFRELDIGDRMYILQEGAVELKKKLENSQIVLKTIETPGDFFGEMALIDGQNRSASAVATRPTVLLVVDHAAFENLILTNGKFALKMIKVLSQRIRSSNRRVEELVDYSPDQRIVAGITAYVFSRVDQTAAGLYRAPFARLREWINSHMAVPVDEINHCFKRLLDEKAISLEGENLLFSEAFLKDYYKKG